ncbi:MAG: hypothetical protein Q7R47_06185, partial [Candidatus Diapherotrites archaeon]|nr:hypothetical protein [Candidatus Diapherotrites archaeon]
GTRLSVLVRDALTSELTQNAVVEVGVVNDGTVTNGLTKPPQFSTVTPTNGFVTFDMALKENEHVLLQVKKAGYQTVRRIITSATVLAKTDDYSCITLDMVAATEGVLEDHVAPGVPYTVSVEVASKCAKTFHLSLEKPSFLTNNDLSMDPSTAFDLAPQATQVISITVSQNPATPKGILPVWLSGKPKDATGPDFVIAVGEIWINDNLFVDPATNTCYGLVEKTA